MTATCIGPVGAQTVGQNGGDNSGNIGGGGGGAGVGGNGGSDGASGFGGTAGSTTFTGGNITGGNGGAGLLTGNAGGGGGAGAGIGGGGGGGRLGGSNPGSGFTLGSDVDNTGSTIKGGTGGAINGGGAAGIGGGGGADWNGQSVQGSGGGALTATGIAITNSGTVQGGAGGGGGGGAGIGGGGGSAGGQGGSGGAFSGTSVTITNAGTITGGNGGADPSRSNGGGNGGAGIGSGGGGHTAGQINSGGNGLTNSTIINSGTITGGNGGNSSSGARGGDGGDGINGSGLTITNNGGTIAGGSAGTGSTNGTAGNAINFTGGTNSLTLNGGTITGNVVANGGTLNLMSTGANTIGGNLTLNSGSTYTVNVTSTGTTDKITVNGTATLAGSVSARAATGTYTGSTTYTILTANALSGTFSGASVNFSFLKPSLTYDSTNVYLTLSMADFVLPTGNGNQNSVGRVLNAYRTSASGDFANVLSALSNLDTAQGPKALDAISGQPSANLGTMNTQTAGAYMGAVGSHLSFTHGGGVGAPANSAQALQASDACDFSCEPAPRATVWVSGVGGVGTVPGSATAGRTTFSFGGAALGADYRLDPSLLIGAGLGFQSGRQWADGFDGYSRSETVNGSLYASYTLGQAYLDGLVSYGRATNSTTRTIAIAGLTTRIALGQALANQFLGQLEAGYKFDVPLAAPASITPFARVQGSTSQQDGFTESGADSLNLTVAAQTTNSLRTVLGADLAAELAKVTFGFRLGWAHEHADVGRPMTASFTGAPTASFTVYGASPARDAAVLGFSLTSKVAEATDAYARYAGEVGNGADSHALTAGLRMAF